MPEEEDNTKRMMFFLSEEEYKIVGNALEAHKNGDTEPHRVARLRSKLRQQYKINNNEE